MRSYADVPNSYRNNTACLLVVGTNEFICYIYPDTRISLDSETVTDPWQTIDFCCVTPRFLWSITEHNVIESRLFPAAMRLEWLFFVWKSSREIPTQKCESMRSVHFTILPNYNFINYWIIGCKLSVGLEITDTNGTVSLFPVITFDLIRNHVAPECASNTNIHQPNIVNSPALAAWTVAKWCCCNDEDACMTSHAALPAATDAGRYKSRLRLAAKLPDSTATTREQEVRGIAACSRLKTRHNGRA